MDVRSWPLDRIMQLPDSCFGRRWPVIITVGEIAPGARRYIAGSALPDRCVLWEMVLYTYTVVSGTLLGVSISLGDQLPATDIAFWALEKLFIGLTLGGATTQDFLVTGNSNFTVRRLKMPVSSQGRRICIRTATASVSWDMVLMLVFSSLPTEVPDWMLSGPARSL